MSDLYKWSKKGMKMLINSGFKEFDRQTNLITSGNCISNTQYSNHIRAYNETENNGDTFEKGHLFNYDLKFFDINKSMREYIKGLNEKICLYEFRIYKNGEKDIIGWLIERKNGQIEITLNDRYGINYIKRYKALIFCKNLISEKSV